MITITTRTDLINYLSDVRADVRSLPRGEEYIAAIADQIQVSDHPAWGSDWTEWLGGIDGLVEATVDGLDPYGFRSQAYAAAESIAQEKHWEVEELEGREPRIRLDE